jgi:hypothetical protein
MEGDVEIMPFSEKTLEAQEKHQRIIEDWENRRRVRQIALPTDDRLVQARLKELGEPIILFGEGPAERRERLREILYTKVSIFLFLSHIVKELIFDRESMKECQQVPQLLLNKVKDQQKSSFILKEVKL